MNQRPTPLFVVAVALLPASFALYLVSLTMFVAQTVKTVQVFGVGKTEVDAYRLLGTIRTLYEDGDVGLAVIITCFTILFPVAKYIALGGVVLARNPRRRDRILRWVKNLGQWSMGDVFVVALLVVIVRINHSVVQVHVDPLPGLWVFAASVLTSMVASALLGFHFDGSCGEETTEKSRGG